MWMVECSGPTTDCTKTIQKPLGMMLEEAGTASNLRLRDVQHRDLQRFTTA